MLRILALVAVSAAAVQLHQSEAAAANPIRRIVNMLQKMQSEIGEEGKKDEKMYEKFYCYCETGAKNLAADIKAGGEKTKQLSADIEAKTARKAQLDEEVTQHRKDREDAKAAMKQATSIREKEKAEFEKETGDFRTNLASMNKAIEVLSKGMGQAFIQSGAGVTAVKHAVAAGSGVSDMEKQEVLSFLEGKSPYGDYQSSSGEIVGIIKAMKDEMDKDLGGALSDEEKAAKIFEELMAEKKAEVNAATAGIEKKVVRSGELAVEITEDKNSLGNNGKEIEANKEFLANMGTTCETKKTEYEDRVKERGDEMLAIAEAIKVLNDDDALDIFKKTMPSPKAVGAVFLQQEPSAEVQAYGYVEQAVQVSQRRAPALALIASMLRTGKVDFGKVFKMIDEMIAHLGQEQKDDNDQLAYCKDELNKNGDAKVTLERDIKDLNASMDELEARMEQLKAEIEELNKRIAETQDSMKEATKQRKDENSEFVTNQAMNNAAKQLVEKAKNRLQKFYNPALYKPPPQRELTEEERIAQNMGEVLPTEAPQYIAGTKITVNLQQLRKDPGPPPEMMGKREKNSKSGGVIGLMDMCLKDLEKQMQQAELDEKTAQTDYEGLMKDAEASVEDDTKSKVGDEAAHAEAAESRQQAETDRAAKNSELESTNKVIADLHGACDFLVENFDFRKEARTNEVEALKNAKAVLAGANFA